MAGRVHGPSALGGWCGGAGERRRPRASAVPCAGAAQTAAEGVRVSWLSHLSTSCKRGVYEALWAHARGPVRSVGVRRCGASLACLCARLSASRGSERPACEAFPAALGATHSVECVPAAARGVPPLAAAPTGADSRAAPRRGGAGRPASVVPGAPPGVAHSAMRARLVAVRGRWSLDGMRGFVGVRGCGGARRASARGGPLWPLRDPAARPARRSAPRAPLCRKGGITILVAAPSCEGGPFLGALSQSTSFSGLRNPIARNQQVPQKIETAHPLHCTPCRGCVPWRGSSPGRGISF